MIKLLVGMFILLSFNGIGQTKDKLIKIVGTVFDLNAYVIITKDSIKARNFVMEMDSSVALDDFKNRGMVFYSEGWPPVLWIPEVPKGIEEYAVLNHEIVHLITCILRWAGVALTKDTEEVYGYMMQYYSKIIYLNIQD